MKSSNKNEINEIQAISLFSDNGKTLQELMEEAFVNYYKTLKPFDNNGKYDIFVVGR